MQALQQARAATRITEDDLRGWSKAELVKLRALGPGSDYPSEKFKVLLERTNIHKAGLNVPELRLVTDLINKIETGLHISGTSFEEMIIPKKGKVLYSPQKTTFVSSDGISKEVANQALPSSEPMNRPGEDRLAAILYSLFDIDKGVLVAIRDPKIDKDMFGSPLTTYNPQAVEQFRVSVVTTIAQYSAHDATFKEKKTITGHMAADYWHGFVRGLSAEDYLAMHSLAMTMLMKGLVPVSTARGTQYKSVVDVKKDDSKEVRIPAASFAIYNPPGNTYSQVSGNAPVVWNKPIKPIAAVPTVKTPTDLLLFHKSSVTLRGGNRRGVGLVASFLDYCPRQSEIIRRLNWFLMAIHNASGAVQVHLKAGDLALMDMSRVQGLSENKRWAQVRFLVPLSETKGQIRKEWYDSTVDSRATQIAILDWLSLPDVVGGLKKVKENQESIEEKYRAFVQFVSGLGPSYLIHTPLFDERQVASAKLFMHGRGHDLTATISTSASVLTATNGKPWKTPISFSTYLSECRDGIRYVNGWHICGEPIYNDLGTWFRCQSANVTVEDGEWKFSNIVPLLPEPISSSTGGGVDDAEIVDLSGHSTPVSTSQQGPGGAPVTNAAPPDPNSSRVNPTSVEIPPQDVDDDEIPEMEIL